MTTQLEAIKAARTFRETQPLIDALKDTVSANTAAKKVLGDYMTVRDLDVFRGVTLRVVPFEAWDNAKLREFLADKVAEFRSKVGRKYFGLAKRAKA